MKHPSLTKSQQIHHAHKDQLRQVLLFEHAQQQHAQREQRSSVLTTLMTSLKSPFMRLSIPLTGIAIAAGVVLWTARYQGADPSHQFLLSAQAAQAAEQQQPQANTFRYQKIRSLTPDALTLIQERWTSSEKSAERVSKEDGTPVSRTVELTDADGTRHVYEQWPTDPILLPMSAFAVTMQDSYCILNVEDELSRSGIDPKSLLDAAMRADDTPQRTELIEQLLKEEKMVDQGEQNGLRTFTLDQYGVVSEYTFDAATYQLKEYEETKQGGTLMKTEYLIDETRSAEQVDQALFDTTGISEVSTGIFASTLDGQPTGCYSTSGEQVGEFEITTERDETNAFVMTMTEKGVTDTTEDATEITMSFHPDQGLVIGVFPGDIPDEAGVILEDVDESGSETESGMIVIDEDDMTEPSGEDSGTVFYRP